MYLVMDKSDRKAGSKAHYRKVAVVEIIDAWAPVPKMISARSKNIKRIVYVLNRLHADGNFSKYHRAMIVANKACEMYNAGDNNDIIGDLIEGMLAEHRAIITLRRLENAIAAAKHRDAYCPPE